LSDVQLLLQVLLFLQLLEKRMANILVIAIVVVADALVVKTHILKTKKAKITASDI
jgi:hypothetical protein